jgi:triphosphatase
MPNEPLDWAFKDYQTNASISPLPEVKYEVELKLLAPAGTLDQLREAAVIARRARNGSVARQLDAVYYDTPDRSLYCHGLSLRVRHNGNGYVQTLKRSPSHGRPFARREWETSVEGVTPDLASLPVSEIGAPLDGLAASTLNPIFATKIRRQTQRLDLPGAVVEVAFDEGTIETGERSEELSEIELEVKAGDPRVLYDLGIELLEIVPLKIGTQSKADRGYGLAYGLTTKATKATTPAITAGHTVDDLVGLLLGDCQHQILVNQTVAEIGNDPEGVHQMRVALRRLRTACALLCHELGSPTLRAVSGEARWLAKILGAARDWDVFITETLSGPASTLTSDYVDFDGLRQAAEPHRAEVYAALQNTLASTRYGRFHLSLRHWIESKGWRNELENRSLAVLLEPAPAFAGQALTRLHGKVVKRGAHFRQLRPEGRHQLRIALKKLRYAMELFHGLHGGDPAATDYLECLSKMQDVLGHDNDAAMTWPLLCSLARDPATSEVQRTVGSVMGWQARDRVEVGKTLRKHWRRFRAMPTFWAS